jgi:protein-L-isoaspartate(D-aspartate) O-methyltransferase
MSVENFDEQRRQLIAAIAADINEVANRIGKTALDKRVLRAMTKVPGHEFVPAEVRTLTRTGPCRSASVKLSRSR